jgi:hypothetical protein
MSGTTPYADHCRDSAADVGARLRALRAHLASLDPARVGLPRARLADLLAGFDIYARMLDDALHDIAAELPRVDELELAGGGAR